MMVNQTQMIPKWPVDNDDVDDNDDEIQTIGTHGRKVIMFAS